MAQDNPFDRLGRSLGRAFTLTLELQKMVEDRTGRIDKVVEELADRIAGNLEIAWSVAGSEPGVSLRVVARAVAWGVLDEWFHGRDTDTDQGHQLDGADAGQDTGGKA